MRKKLPMTTGIHDLTKMKKKRSIIICIGSAGTKMTKSKEYTRKQVNDN